MKICQSILETILLPHQYLFGVAWEYQHICLIMKDNYWSIFDWYLCYVQWLYYDGYKGYEVMILLIVLYWDSLHLTCIYYHILNEDIELHHHNNLINFVYYVDLDKFIPYTSYSVKLLYKSLKYEIRNTHSK